MMRALPYIDFQPQKLWLKILNRNGSNLGTSAVPLYFNPDQHQLTNINIHQSSTFIINIHLTNINFLLKISIDCQVQHL